MRDDSRPVLTIVRNEASFNAGLAWLYRDCVNSDAFFDAGPGMVKVSNISATRKWNPLFGWYWPVSYEFTFDANGYAKYLLNQGFRELDSDTGKLKLVTVNGVPVSEPVLLSKKGQVMPPNSPPYGLKFDIYYEASFGVFNF